MRIIIDMQGAQTASRFRGIGRYSTALAQAMVRQGGNHDIWLAVNGGLDASIPSIRQAFADLLPARKIVQFESLSPVAWQDPANAWRRGVSERMRENFLRDLQPDIVHVSSLFEGTQDRAVTSIGAYTDDVSGAVTLYDLIPLLNPDHYLSAAWVREWYMSKVASLKRAGVLLAISEHAKSEAVQMLDMDPGCIVNISSAVSPAFRPTTLSEAERLDLYGRFGILGPYVMYSGAMDPRKNVEGLIKAFGLLPDDLRQSHQIVIAGKIAPLDQERLEQAARRQGLSDRIVFTGYISDEDLIHLYGATALYVFPSLHEGFGLPALEAMACGVPTIGSSTTSIPEVIGRADALFDPTDPEAIARVMVRALVDKDFNSELRRHAITQSSKFSWDASAQKAISAFEASHERSTSSTRAWSAVLADIDRHYRELVTGIAVQPAGASPPSRHDLQATAAAIAENQVVATQALRVVSELPAKLAWRVEGPFDSSYSLALVNRELALALSADGHDVALHSTEGPGDFEPSKTFLASRPDIAQLHARCADLSEDAVDVSSRELYPPRVSDMCSRINLLHNYAWEESALPANWVDDFNESLQGIVAVSSHVEKILVDNGVEIALAVGGNGTDHWQRIDADHSFQVQAKAFRFLHVSSCFPRKGVDALLDAYGQSFSAGDDVSLIIKTFANPHNEVHAWLAEAKGSRDDFPDVQIIEDDLSDGRLKALYEQCHVLVAPSRAEGFGLPLAEAMLSGLGVITTGWGGQLDFCNEDTAWLVDYSFAEAKTHFGLFNSVWAEPSRSGLAEVMRKVHALPESVRMERVSRGRQLLATKFRWSDVAQRTAEFVREVAASPSVRAPKVGWITSWNTKCGIASYSGHLLKYFPGDACIFAAHANDTPEPDGVNVNRCWSSSGPESLDGLSRAIDAAQVDAIVLQFQFGFFEFPALSRFLLGQQQAGRTVVVMMHATKDPDHAPDRKLSVLADALKGCDRILVHGVADLNRLKGIGLVDNVAIFPHGIVDFTGASFEPFRRDTSFKLASYGFALPHKGLPQLVEAVSMLVAKGADVELRMVNAEYPVGESKALIEDIRRKISTEKLDARISLLTDYLTDDESLRLLANADLVVFPYQGTGESSSAAVRYGLASNRPVAVTPISIFDDVGGAVHRLPGVRSEDLAAGIKTIMSRKNDDRGVFEVAERWRAAHRYSGLGRRLYNMIGALHRARADSRTIASRS